MIVNKNVPQFINVNNNYEKFFLDEADFLNSQYKNTLTQVCPYKIWEFDIDLDNKGNLHIVVYTKCNKLLYLYRDDTKWYSDLLYESTENEDIIKHVSIITSNSLPNILFCWKNNLKQSNWSIISYHEKNNKWTKHVFTRVRIKLGDNNKPYSVIKDENEKIHIIYLANDNLVYNVMHKYYLNNTWSSPLKLSTCIYGKYPLISMIIDKHNRIHITYSDKIKNNYCIKYMSISDIFTQNKIHIAIESEFPLENNILIVDNDVLYSYCFSDNNIIVYKMMKNKFNRLSNLKQSLLHLYKLHKRDLNMGTYILSSSENTPKNIILEDIDKSLIQLNVSDSLNETMGQDKYKKLQLEIYKKNQEINSKNMLLHSLDAKIKLMSDEINKLNKEKNTYMNILNDKYKKVQNNIKHKDDKYNKILEDYNNIDKQNSLLEDSLVSYKEKILRLENNYALLHTENTELKKEIAKYNNENPFKKLFFNKNK